MRKTFIKGNLARVFRRAELKYVLSDAMPVEQPVPYRDFPFANNGIKEGSTALFEKFLQNISFNCLTFRSFSSGKQSLPMMYKSFLPAPSLREFVRNYTLIQFQFNNHENGPRKQRPPKPEQKIVFYIKGAPSIRNHATGCSQTPPPVSIYSHQRDKTTIQMESEFSAFIIFLQPGVLHRLIRLPMLELPHGSFDAELFFGTEVRNVLDQLASAGSASSMISIIEQFLFAKCKHLKEKSAIDAIADYLLVDPTHFSLDAIARQACLSSKQFYRKFTVRIGMSPKLYSRLSRFNHAHRYKIVHPYVSWPSIAQEFRYTDYHHMEKEFKEFAGHTPQEWINIELAAPERILRLR